MIPFFFCKSAELAKKAAAGAWLWIGRQGVLKMEALFNVIAWICENFDRSQVTIEDYPELTHSRKIIDRAGNITIVYYDLSDRKVKIIL